MVGSFFWSRLLFKNNADDWFFPAKTAVAKNAPLAT